MLYHYQIFYFKYLIRFFEIVYRQFDQFGKKIDTSYI